jgi:hypothetical protein
MMFPAPINLTFAVVFIFINSSYNAKFMPKKMASNQLNNESHLNYNILFSYKNIALSYTSEKT